MNNHLILWGCKSWQQSINLHSFRIVTPSLSPSVRLKIHPLAIPRCCSKRSRRRVQHKVWGRRQAVKGLLVGICLERNLNPNLTNQIKFYMLEMSQFLIQRPINPSQDDQGDEGFGREPEGLRRAVVFVFDIFRLPSWVGAWKREIPLISFCWSWMGKGANGS